MHASKVLSHQTRNTISSWASLCAQGEMSLYLCLLEHLHFIWMMKCTKVREDLCICTGHLSISVNKNTALSENGISNDERPEAQ